MSVAEQINEEILEQARLLGMSAERELDLLAKYHRLLNGLEVIAETDLSGAEDFAKAVIADTLIHIARNVIDDVKGGKWRT